MKIASTNSGRCGECHFGWPFGIVNRALDLLKVIYDVIEYHQSKKKHFFCEPEKLKQDPNCQHR